MWKRLPQFFDEISPDFVAEIGGRVVRTGLAMNSLSQLDRYLPEKLRSHIEQRYYARVNAQAHLDQAIHDPEFLGDMEGHVMLISDHGVVHARDVAQQILQVLDVIHSVLIPARDLSRLEFMKGYGVMLAYIHDIGMLDFSWFGRAVHPEFATQAVFGPEFDAILETIWDENCGNLAWRLTRLVAQGALPQDPQSVLREMLAMANCHSKTKVPIDIFGDLQGLRHLMQTSAATPLRRLYHQQQAEKDRHAPRIDHVSEGDPLQALRRHYTDFERDSFQWLLSAHSETRDLVSDVLDTLRALRCADALRQRGTVLKTSGSYEIFVDQRTANAIYALRLGEDQLFLLERPDPLPAGEANIASSEIDHEGNLRIAFHRGAFPDQATVQRAAYNAALAVNDIQADTIESFRRPKPADRAGSQLKEAGEAQILLEGVDDNLGFAELVCQQLQLINPQAGARARSAPSLQNASVHELTRYLAAEAFDADVGRRREVLERISQSGHKTQDMDPVNGFKDVRLIRLKAGQVLIEAGSPSGFVYIPLGDGLKIIPLGGYAPFLVRPWMPLGITGVIRGAVRNATVVTEQDVALLMIPKEVYLREWHHTYGAAELTQLFARRI
jgi:hypothetical protein